MHALVFAVMLLSGAAAAQEAAPRAHVAILAPSGSEEAQADWSQLQAYLERALPGVAVRFNFFDLGGLHAAISERTVDFFIANSGFYVDLEASHGATRIATLESPDALSPTQAIASAVIVRADRSDLQQLADVRGKRLAAVGQNAFGGWQVAWRELLRAGVDPQRDLRELRFTGYPIQRVVQAVARGEVDAGVVRACLLENMASQGAVRLAEFRVLGSTHADGYACRRSTPLYPDWPFAALVHTPNDLAKRVATALLAMPKLADGRAWTVPTDYRPVHELFRELEIGPYAYLRERSVEAFLRRYWWAFVVAFLVLAAWVAHTVRVEVLVMQRTRALREALAAREAAERAAREQQERAEHLSRLGILGEMSSMLAHELNQPLSAIGNFARGMALRIEAGRGEPAALLEAAREIATQAERAAGIMQRIRGFARRRLVERAPLPLREVIEESLRLFRGMQSQPPDVVLDEGCIGEIVSADRLQVEQVLLNLLKNALDAMQNVAPAARRITVSCRVEGGQAVVAVSDCGAGLDEAARARLFEPFFTTKPDGVGLGLAICKSAIEAHGGRLWAQANADGPGLTVAFSIPLAKEASDV